MLEQAVNLPGINNARELGGFPAGDRHVKKGVLLRTGGLARASAEALEQLSNTFALQTVVDFRMSPEVLKAPDPQVPGATNCHLPVMETEDFLVPEDLDPRALQLFGDPAANRMQLFELTYDLGMLGPEMYVGFLLGERGKRAYAGFLQKLLELEEGRAILWHCTDGKDRTGLAAMLTLYALGASRETVIEDYLLTNEYNAAAVETTRQQVAAYSMPQEKVEALLVMSGAVAEHYMTHAIDTLEQRYGSVVGYITSELGVGPEELELLRDRFLV